MYDPSKKEKVEYNGKNLCQCLKALAQNRLEFSATELFELAGDALERIMELESECERAYDEGRADGMVRAMELLRGGDGE